MRIIPLTIIAALVGAAAYAQTPAPVTGDFDSDGKQDTATMTVADGKFSIDVKFGGEPARTINVIKQPVALAPKQMALRRPGNYALARATRSRDGKMVNTETTTHDAIAIKFEDETYWSIFHLNGDYFSAFISPG